MQNLACGTEHVREHVENTLFLHLSETWPAGRNMFGNMLKNAHLHPFANMACGTEHVQEHVKKCTFAPSLRTRPAGRNMFRNCSKRVRFCTVLQQSYLMNGSQYVRFDVFVPPFLSRCENCSIPANTFKMDSFWAPEMLSVFSMRARFCSKAI